MTKSAPPMRSDYSGLPDILALEPVQRAVLAALSGRDLFFLPEHTRCFYGSDIPREIGLGTLRARLAAPYTKLTVYCIATKLRVRTVAGSSLSVSFHPGSQLAEWITLARTAAACHGMTGDLCFVARNDTVRVYRSGYLANA